jgi:hypothetical protein
MFVRTIEFLMYHGTPHHLCVDPRMNDGGREGFGREEEEEVNIYL